MRPQPDGRRRLADALQAIMAEQARLRDQLTALVRGEGVHLRPLAAVEFARAFGSVDAVLLQHWETLPAPAQEALIAVYVRLDLEPPGEVSSAP